MPGSFARFGPMHAMRRCVARSLRRFNRGRVACNICGPVSGRESSRTAAAAIVGRLKSLKVMTCSCKCRNPKVFSREQQRDRLGSARSCGLAPLPHPVGCRWQWYISKLLFHGDSSKIIPPTWQARHHVPPAPTAMHALYVCAHGCVKHIYSGVGEKFFSIQNVCFDLGKLFPQLQGVGE